MSLDVPDLPDDAPGWQRIAHRVVHHSVAQTLIVTAIVLNGIVLGLQTFDFWSPQTYRILDLTDRVFLSIFVVEIAVRFVAYGCRPGRYLRNGWNAFDTVVVLLAVLPIVAGNSSVLRLIRVLRIARLARVMPDITVLLDGLRRVARPAATLMALTALMVFLYGMVGIFLFAEGAPQYFGNISRAMLTLFELLTLEGWNDILHELISVRGAVGGLYTISFVLIGTYIVINLMVAVVISSLDEAHKERIRTRHDDTADLHETLNEMNGLVERLQRRLAELERDRPGPTR